ncbi:signal peptidase complex subunit 1 [Cylas formicarius]|uniref:signal peptidase complex subunit 1 n=1 Tax=Cylas formicarius TaxID=197179 RepID=UPI0029586B31|nr:signal peptidase complex subunit 1 [Cylas formicarius]
MDFIKNIPTHLDYEGQARAEKLSRIIITLFGAVGLIWGYIIQQFSQTVYILGAGFLLAALLTLPPWPMYRRKPLNWQPARVGEGNASTTKEASKKSKKKN